ncbi:MAG TPA: molybdate ABC transporter substrate-binding protein [Polyangia bacterium]|nr:molybdate ABC transporter substrate-binding protein [Polyangia bacterium]
MATHRLDRRRAAAAGAALLALLALLALRAPAARADDLIVFEAASLKDAFATVASRFQAAHPGTHVVTNAAGSQELRAQIEHGAPADLFASADRRHMDALAAAKLVDAPAVFTCNQLVVVTRPGLDAVKELGDLPRADRVVVGAPEVPVGAYTAKMLDGAARVYGTDFRKRVDAKVVSRELNVRQVLAKVLMGEADAAVVYASDAVAARGKLHVLPIPAPLSPLAEYPVAVVRGARRPDLARAFIELLKGPTGAAALRDAGFIACPAR